MAPGHTEEEPLGAICSVCGQAVRLEYWRTARVRVTTAKTTSVASGCAMSRMPAPFTSTAREIVTKCRTGFTCDTTCTHGAMLSIGEQPAHQQIDVHDEEGDEH